MDGTQGVLKEICEFFVNSDSLRDKKRIVAYYIYEMQGDGHLIKSFLKKCC